MLQRPTQKTTGSQGAGDMVSPQEQPINWLSNIIPLKTHIQVTCYGHRWLCLGLCSFIILSLLLCLFLFYRQSFSVLHWLSQTWSVDQAYLRLRDLPAFLQNAVIKLGATTTPKEYLCIWIYIYACKKSYWNKLSGPIKMASLYLGLWSENSKLDLSGSLRQREQLHRVD